MKIGFSKKLLFADYIIALMLIIGFFICITINGIYGRHMFEFMVSNGIDVSNLSLPQLFSLEGFGILLASWVIQLGISSGAYYILCKSEHKIQLPMQLIKELPDDIKENVDMTQIITTVLNSSDN